jgi:PAS domain S-box-containing protein
MWQGPFHLSYGRSFHFIEDLWQRGLRPGSPAAFAFALACVSIAALVRFGLHVLNPDLSPFSVFYPAVLLSAFIGGAGAGIAAIVLSMLLGMVAFLNNSYLHSNGFPLTAEEGINLAIFIASSLCILWVAVKIRHMRQQIEEHFAASSQFAALVTHSADAVIGVGTDGRVNAWNRGAELLLGYAAHEIVGRSLRILISAEETREFENRLERITRGESFRFDAVRIRKDGTRVDVAVSTGPIRSSRGEVVGVSAIMRDISERKRREQHLAFTMRELTHRSKNLLSVIQAMARQTALQSASFEDFEARFIGRLQALAYGHDLLVKRDWAGAPITAVVQAQLTPFAELGDGRVQIKGPGFIINPKAAEHLSLAIHELATNAVKHGALSKPQGRVCVSWELTPCGSEPPRFSMTWREYGSDEVRPPVRKGFGHVVIERVMPSALGGKALLKFEKEGFSWTFVTGARQILNDRQDGGVPGYFAEDPPAVPMKDLSRVG